MMLITPVLINNNCDKIHLKQDNDHNFNAIYKKMYTYRENKIKNTP